MMKSHTQLKFVNANLEEVPYDGSEISWRVSAYALIIKNGQVLLAKSKLENYYDVLGGGVDIGETIEEALVREALEEGGVQISIGKLQFSAIDWFYHRNGRFHQTLQLYYQAGLIGESSKPTDPNIEWTGFVPIEEVENKYKLAASPFVVESIKRYLGESKFSNKNSLRPES